MLFNFRKNGCYSTFLSLTEWLRISYRKENFVIWEVYTFIQPAAFLSKSKVRGYTGALLAGLLGGLFASSCATPVLMALLTVVISQDNLLWGVVLLFCYALGNGLLIVIMGTSFGAVQQMKQTKTYAAFTRISRIVMGFIVLLLGLWFFYMGF